MNKNKRLGQVFLRDTEIVKRIIQAADIKPRENILEIGPGSGNLTAPLIQTQAMVTAVEKDPRWTKFLSHRFSNISNLEIIQKDIRDFLQDRSHPIFQSKYKVVGNIPYYLTARLLRLLLNQPNRPRLIVLMIQEEVAERITAIPPHMNLLAASVQFYGQTKIISMVERTKFTPPPHVDSAVIKITPLINPANTDPATTQAFFTVLKIGFKHPRKLLISNLANDLPLPKSTIQKTFQNIGLSEKTRPHDLSIPEWITLSSLLKKNIV